jgi:uncharacterized glyoxalase superfamily protein PhnB
MINPPEGWPRISPALFYDDASAAIDWLSRAFGFETRLKVEGEPGQVVHSELVFKDGVIMVATAEGKGELHKSPRALGGATSQSVLVYVDDIEAHCARARAAGARILEEPATKDYGDDYGSARSYQALDLEGHHWWFTQHLTGPKK